VASLQVGIIGHKLNDLYTLALILSLDVQLVTSLQENGRKWDNLLLIDM